MFKNLKEQITTQAAKTNQAIMSTILSATATPTKFGDENLDNNRSRLNSASSDITQTSVSLTRQFMPPSDIESEYGADEIDHSTNSNLKKSFAIVKNKYNQLKKAYDEVENEKTRIEILLQKTQDTLIERQKQLREAKQEKKFHENQIEELNQQLLIHKNLYQSEQEEHRNLDEKYKKLEIVSTRNQEKQTHLINERNTLQQQLNEAQILIDSMINEHHSQDKSIESLTKIKDEFNCQIKSLLNEKEQLEKCIQTIEQENNQLKQISQISSEQSKDEDINQLKAQIRKLECDLNESLIKSSELTRKFDDQQKKYLEKIELEEQFEQVNCAKLKIENLLEEKEKEIETLKCEIVSLLNSNNENTRRLDEFDNEKFNFEQEINEKNRIIKDRDEKMADLQLSLQQTQENATKLRNALQKTNAEQMSFQEAEKRFEDQKNEFNEKLKAMAKEMNSTIEEKERTAQQQLQEFAQKHHQNEREIMENSEKRIRDAEQRALNAERQMSAMHEDFKQKQLDHHRNIQDLQVQIQKLIKENIPKIDRSSQTIKQEADSNALVFQPTEIDYLKKIFFAYMTGTDRMTMAKVLCAILRYSDQEKMLIVEQEKLRQSRWINPPK